MVLQNEDVVILDMEAGIEHLGRGTAQGVNAFIVVVEPGARSLQTYAKIKKLALDIGVTKVFAVGNKVKNQMDKEYILSSVDGTAFLGFISYSEAVVGSDRAEQSPFADNNTVKEVRAIKEQISLATQG